MRGRERRAEGKETGTRGGIALAGVSDSESFSVLPGVHVLDRKEQREVGALGVAAVPCTWLSLLTRNSGNRSFPGGILFFANER